MTSRAAYEPLFDLLAPFAVHDVPSATASARQGSVARDLGRLLNARSRFDGAGYLAADPLSLDYGIPDLSAISSRLGLDRHMIASVVERAIGRFEPRLTNVRATLSPPASGRAEPLLFIDADLRGSSPSMSRVHFEMAVPGHSREDDAVVCRAETE